MTTITYAGGITITPEQTTIATASFASAPGVIVHDILDGPPVRTLRPAGPRTGRLRLGFTNEQAAIDCFEVHGVPALFTIESDERISLNFDYIVTGRDITLELDADTGRLWFVDVPYQVVA